MTLQTLTNLGFYDLASYIVIINTMFGIDLLWCIWAVIIIGSLIIINVYYGRLYTAWMEEHFVPHKLNYGLAHVIQLSIFMLLNTTALQITLN